MDFSGVALVTGAASGDLHSILGDSGALYDFGSAGIGRATALLYSAEGCKRIVIADLNTNDLLSTKKQIESAHPGTKVKAITVDVRNQDEVQGMVDEAVRTFGRIDYCANVAGIIRFGDTSILSVDDFEEVYQVNLRGVFLTVKAQINAMLEQEPLISR